MPGNGNIFISHTHVDSALCVPLLAALRAWGADYWFATKRMDSAQSIPATIQQAIADRDIFIRICTPAALLHTAADPRFRSLPWRCQRASNLV